MLSVEAVSKSFQHPSGVTRVLHDMSFEVESGEFVTIFGPNGSGKTTLLNILADIETPDSGQVSINGKDPSTADIGFVFQNYHESLFPWKTVFENIVFPLEIRCVSKDISVSLVEDILRKVGLLAFKNRYIYDLSGGQKQLVSICRSLVIQPEVLFLDEPFSALDYSTTREMELELLNIWQEMKITTVFVSHDIDEAIFLADRILILSPRPAEIKAVIPIPLTRPRTPEMFVSEEFLALKKSVLEVFAYEK